METVEESPAAIYVVTQQDIARSGVLTIPDALRMVPGVNVAQGPSGGWAVNIRGFNKGLANQLLVMIDGRTIYNPLFAGTYWDLQNMPMENIERIEVVRGPGGALWGANAVNGVINIITKGAEETQGTLIRAAAGNLRKDSVLGQRGAKISEDSYYRIYAQHLNDGPMRSPAGGRATNAMRDSRAGFRFDQGDTLTISGDAYANTTSQLTSVPQLAPPYAVTQGDSHVSEGANLLARWEKGYEGGSHLSFQSYLDYTRRDQVILKDEESTFDVDLQYNMRPMGPHEIITGGGYRLIHADIGNTYALSINPAVSTRNVFNVFAQDKVTIVPERLFLTVGSKLEHNDYTGFEIEPSARLQLFPDDHQTLWAAVSRAVRTPSPLENNLDLIALVFPPFTGALNAPFPVEYNLVANPDFQSESLLAYEVGYRNKITPDVSADLTAFFNNYSDLAAQKFVGFALVPPAGIPQYAKFMLNQSNLMSAETYGLEAAADWSVTPDWKLSGSAGLLKMNIHLFNDFTNQQAQENQSPQQQYSLRSYWNINESLSFDTAAYYVGGLRDFDVPSYVRVDANLGWKIDSRIQFNLVGQNLLQSTHREYGDRADLNATEIPRSFYAKITCKF